MVEYHTRYPRLVIPSDGVEEELNIHPRDGIEQLYIVVMEEPERLYQMFRDRGFVRVRFEHKFPHQFGSGLSLRLDGPWEMHVRLSSIDGGVMIHAEVEISRDYMQHLFSQRTPVIYEITRVLEANQIKYRIWNERTGKYIARITKNYKITLSTPSLPAFAWKPMVFSIGTVGLFYLIKYLLTV